MTDKLYKVTGPNGAAYHGGTGYWPLPDGDKAGDWLEVKGDIVPCENGLHLCRQKDLLDWLGPVIWEAEHEGEMIEAGNKVVVRKARLLRRCGGWNEQTARLFAADCAERVLNLANDKRCDAAVFAARQYAFGLVGNAAWAAARDAAWAAARDAAWAAAWAAARAAAVDAARAAARAAAWAAAWAAARAAAWDAAWDAARAAAMAAARDVERQWQQDRLMQYLAGQVDLDAIKRSVTP